MKVSQKTDYALRALYVLAQYQPSGSFVRTAEIAKREKMPMKFLEAILVELRRAGFVLSQRGAEGGHRLARPASEITVGEVWRALDGSLSPTADLADGKRRAATGGVFKFVWEDVATATSRVVDAITLADVVRRAEANRGALDFSI
jgi:Rrf2 family transcriptional regulator, cysteine metabolism repressor